MSQELLYTSAPNGLKPGSRGFCTVLSTQGMPAPLATAVEGLSGYRPIYPPSDERASQNPIVFAHLKLQAAGRSWDVLSRVADYGLDYSGRPNKLAHHVIVDKSAEKVSAGPAALLAMPGFMRTQWQGEPKVVALKTVTSASDERQGVCINWQEATGDAGWAGVIAESFLANPDRLVFVFHEAGQSILPLFEEAISLLPPDKRWNVTFSTYFTGLLPGTTCNWRGIISGTKEANESKRFVDALRIDLNQPPPSPDQAGALVEAARTGRRSFSDLLSNRIPQSSDFDSESESNLNREEEVFFDALPENETKFINRPEDVLTPGSHRQPPKVKAPPVRSAKTRAEPTIGQKAVWRNWMMWFSVLTLIFCVPFILWRPIESRSRPNKVAVDANPQVEPPQSSQLSNGSVEAKEDVVPRAAGEHVPNSVEGHVVNGFSGEQQVPKEQSEDASSVVSLEVKEPIKLDQSQELEKIESFPEVWKEWSALDASSVVDFKWNGKDFNYKLFHKLYSSTNYGEKFQSELKQIPPGIELFAPRFVPFVLRRNMSSNESIKVISVVEDSNKSLAVVNVCLHGKGRDLRYSLVATQHQFASLLSWCVIDVVQSDKRESIRFHAAVQIVGDPARISNESTWATNLPFVTMKMSDLMIENVRLKIGNRIWPLQVSEVSESQVNTDSTFRFHVDEIVADLPDHMRSCVNESNSKISLIPRKKGEELQFELSVGAIYKNNGLIEGVEKNLLNQLDIEARKNEDNMRKYAADSKQTSNQANDAQIYDSLRKSLKSIFREGKGSYVSDVSARIRDAYSESYGGKDDAGVQFPEKEISKFVDQFVVLEKQFESAKQLQRDLERAELVSLRISSECVSANAKKETSSMHPNAPKRTTLPKIILLEIKSEGDPK